MFAPTPAQILYGAEWASYDVPAFVDSMFVGIRREFERVYWNIHQEQHEGQTADLGRVFYRAYAWDACDCGGQYPQHSEECLRVRHEWNSRRLHAISEDDAAGFGRRVFFDRSDAWEAANPCPACQCGAEDGWEERGCAETCVSRLPNFGLRGDAVQIRWYKHPGRGMSTSVQMTADEWVAWHDRVMEALDDVEHAHDISRFDGYCGRYPCRRCGKGIDEASGSAR